MLEIKDIYKTFNAGTINEKRALNGVNLNLNPGDFVTIIGGNGAGKSTTLNAIAGVWGIDKGISSSTVLTSQNFLNINVRSSSVVCSRIL